MRRSLLILAIAATAATPAIAQQQSGTAANAVVTTVRTWWLAGHNNVLRSAEQAPESLYAFRPVEGVRSLGELFGHVADAQSMICAIALGEAPSTESAEKTQKTKSSLVDALKASNVICDRAYAQSDADSHATIKLFGQDRSRLNALTLNATHSWEHYGNIVTYLRLNGLVPPSSQR